MSAFFFRLLQSHLLRAGILEHGQRVHYAAELPGPGCFLVWNPGAIRARYHDPTRPDQVTEQVTAILKSALPGLAGLLLVMCNDQAGQSVELTGVQAYLQDQESLARGEALFLGSCAGFCHQLVPEPTETTDASYLFDCEWLHGSSDDELFDIISKGIPNTRMVGFGDNFPEGDEDKWKLIAFLRSRQEPCR